MFATPISTNSQPTLPGNSRGGVQHDIFFSVMKIIHRQLPPPPEVPPLPIVSKADNPAPRLSCCCRLSELMPLVRQLHDEARARAAARTSEQRQQAA